MTQHADQFPPVGGRFRLKRLVDRLPDFEAQKGMTGTIKISRPDLIALDMDTPLALTPEGREQWGNCIHWYPDYEPGKTVIQDFQDDCEPISALE